MSHTSPYQSLPLSQLDQRARDVFRDIVETFLETGSPVGSRTLARSSALSLSPASIRNVMADLAQLGLLDSDHVSAGRKPSHLGLRLFVDGLLEIGDVSAADRRKLERQMSSRSTDPDSVMNEAGHILSGLAGGAGLVLAPVVNTALKHVEFVPLDPSRALVVLVYADGHVENRVMPLPSGLLPASLQSAGNFLSARLSGRTLDEARTEILSEIKTGRAQLDAAAAKLIENGLADWSGDQKRSLIVRGRSRLLDNLAAQTDLERIQKLFEDLERKEELISLLDRTETADGVKIFIGAENPLFSLSGSSVVVAPYRDAKQNIIGAVGVIGPTRLNYARVIPLVDFTAQLVGKLLKSGQ